MISQKKIIAHKCMEVMCFGIEKSSDSVTRGLPQTLGSINVLSVTSESKKGGEVLGIAMNIMLPDLN
jgi:hypothetical protein